MKFALISKEDLKSLEIRQYLENKIQLPMDKKNPDIVIAVGGDGTFIWAAHQYPKAILFGVHTGHLGFYANYTINDLDALLEDIHKECFLIEELETLQVEVKTEKQTLKTFAVNEMTIITPPRTLILDVYIDHLKLESFRGTGFCISTPYGSTAYNKSLHGAVLDPRIKAFQLTEIAGLNSNQYRTLSSPLLLSEDRIVTLCANQVVDVNLTVDNLSYSLKDFKDASVCFSKNKIKVAYHQAIEFTERIKRTFL